MAPIEESSALWRFANDLAFWIVAACLVGAFLAFLFPGHGADDDDDLDVPEMSPATAARLAALVRGERFIAHRADRDVLPDVRDGVAGYLVDGPTAPLYPVCPPVALGLDRDPVLGTDQHADARHERLRMIQGGRRNG